MLQQQQKMPIWIALLISLWVPSVGAGEVRVEQVEVQHQREDQYRFVVTLRHGDEGWAHYADAWEVIGPDGQVLGRRTLAHPHVHEQPFTRSLGGVRIPTGVRRVGVRAHDKVHGHGPVRTVSIPEP